LLRRSLLRNFRAAGLDLRKGSARRFAHRIAKSCELFAALSLNFVRKGRRRRIGSFREKRPRPVERLTHHFFHLRLCVLHKAAARMIQFRREDARDFACLFAQLIARVFHRSFRHAHNLRLHFLLVPFRGLVHLFHGIVANVNGAPFELR